MLGFEMFADLENLKKDAADFLAHGKKELEFFHSALADMRTALEKINTRLDKLAGGTVVSDKEDNIDGN